MPCLRVAAATDDGDRFMKRHFGDATFYGVYEITPTGYSHVGDVTNDVTEDVTEDEGHANPEKAQGIAEILKGQGVQVAAARVFGPNIKRIKTKFVCVLTGHESISDCLDLLVAEFTAIHTEFKKGAERGFLDWRDR